MKGLLADINIAGNVQQLVDSFFSSEGWSELWDSLGLSFVVFANIGLDERAPDDIVWQTCQDYGLVLITANRNNDGPRSLEATIRERLIPESFPVITVSNGKSLGMNAAYISPKSASNCSNIFWTWNITSVPDGSMCRDHTNDK